MSNKSEKVKEILKHMDNATTDYILEYVNELEAENRDLKLKLIDKKMEDI